MPRMLIVAAMAAFLVPTAPLPGYAQDGQDSYAADAFMQEPAIEKASRHEVMKLRRLRNKIARTVFGCDVDKYGELSCPMNLGPVGWCQDDDIFAPTGVPELYIGQYSCFPEDELVRVPADLEVESTLLYTDKYHAYFNCQDQSWWGDKRTLAGFAGTCTVENHTYRVKVVFSRKGDPT